MKHHKLFYASSYDRGLDILLPMWPQIRGKFPDATLDVCYGWDLYDSAYKDNPERQQWKDIQNKQMEAEGITHHGRVGKEELAKIRQSCGIWAYPTYFAEINCITALDCQKDGVVPVTIDNFALSETVQSGVKIKGDIYDNETKEKYVSELLGIMGDKERWKKESKKAQEFAKNYTWDKIAQQWEVIFNAKRKGNISKTGSSKQGQEKRGKEA